jgi:hypothetical protein
LGEGTDVTESEWLAEAAYEHRLLPSGELDQERLSILADALEDAGCTDCLLPSWGSRDGDSRLVCPTHPGQGN